MIPHNTPRNINSKKNFIGSVANVTAISNVGNVITGGMCSGVAVIVSKTGRTPKTILTINEAITAAVTDAIKISCENLLRISSMQKITPASGALKIAARPAPAPAVNKKFPSVSS